MKCLHCLKLFHDSWKAHPLPNDFTGQWIAETTICPACKQITVRLKHTIIGRLAPNKGEPVGIEEYYVHPKALARAIDKEVPDPYAQDFKEACLVLSDSPKASAALSRRCLQHLLREKAGVKHGTLSSEIQQVIDSKDLPSHLSEDIDGVREYGNLAAHTTKDTNTGEIVDVEPGEAEWLLDTLEGLFDFYFVHPARSHAKRAALDAKLKKAGKPPMKKSKP